LHPTFDVDGELMLSDAKSATHRSDYSTEYDALLRLICLVIYESQSKGQLRALLKHVKCDAILGLEALFEINAPPQVRATRVLCPQRSNKG